MKKKIFNYATNSFENLNAEDDIIEMQDVKTLKPKAVPPKTETFKKPVIKRTIDDPQVQRFMGIKNSRKDDLDIIYDAMDIFEKGTFNHNHIKQYGVTYAEARNKRLKENN